VVNRHQKWLSTIRKIISPPKNAKTNERKIEFMKNRNTITICTTILPLLIAGVLAGFGLLPKANAVVPAPDGGYPGFNTAEGQNALFSLTTGQGNTAVGWLSLRALTQGSFNTAIGAGTLLANTADQNTATGAGTLLSNTTGLGNTANGAFALFSNTTGGSNTAIGWAALRANTGGAFPSGSQNTAIGTAALLGNTTGGQNTAIGTFALHLNTTGGDNTALGWAAGEVQTTGSGNVCIGANVFGAAGESNRTRIRNIGSTAIVGGSTVVVAGTGGIGDGFLGYNASSRRYKQDIKPMDNASERLLALKPVIFRAKGDPTHLTHYGLIAEDVAKVNPDLAGYNADGQPETVRYDAVNAMLLNEFLKEHRKNKEQKATIAQLKSTVEKQEATNAQQQKQIEALTAGLQKVSAQVEMGRPAPRVVVKNQ
jgi:hypothetical protein